MPFTRPTHYPGLLYDAASRVAAQQDPSRDVITELGWSLVLVPEAAGGLGGTWEDLAAIVEGLAVHASHLPVIERCAVAPLLLSADARWHKALAEDHARLLPLLGRAYPFATQRVQAQRHPGGVCLQGTVRGVYGLDSTTPTHWVVLAALPDDDTIICVVEHQHMPPPHAHYRAMDGQATADIHLSAVAIPEDACIAVGTAAQQAIVRAEQCALAMLCVESATILGSLVELTVSHLNSRQQFGVALSTFQALRHQLAHVYVQYESGRGMVGNALAQLQQGASDAARHLHLTKLALGEAVRHSAETIIQLHGGMGMSRELLAARLAQRGLANEFRFGDRFTHSAILHQVL